MAGNDFGPRTAKASALIAGGLGLGAAVVGLIVYLGIADPPPAEPAVVAPPPAVPSDHPAVAVPTAVQAPVRPSAEDSLVALADPTKSTVAWPVKLKLELLAPANLPKSSGLSALGSGAEASLVGTLRDGRDLPVSASVTFIAGPNQGRVLRTNSDGRFGASDLYPGLSVVEIDGGGEFTSRREVRLRNGAETSLPIGFGMPGAARGKVLDREGKPIAGAQVEIDGRITFSDLDGAFLHPAIPSGTDLECIVSRPGYAAVFQLLTIAARQTREDLVFTLFPGATLDVEVPEAIGAPTEAQILLIPAGNLVSTNSWGQRSFPWRTKSPCAIQPGSRLRIEDLPPNQRVRVFLFHRGAYAKPTSVEARLEEGMTAVATLHLEAAPVVVGTARSRDGLVVPGARIRLEAPDRAGAACTFFEQPALFLESDVLPSLPVGVQEMLSDHNGRFEFTSYPKQAPRRYLVGESADGLLRGIAIVGPSDQTVDLVLSAAGVGSATLRVEFPGRHQALPVECSVEGAPRDPFLLPAHEPYVIDRLAPGTWRLSATWNGTAIPGVDGPEGVNGFSVVDDAQRVIELPQGAILGQDQDTLLRAGRLR